MNQEVERYIEDAALAYDCDDRLTDMLEGQKQMMLVLSGVDPDNLVDEDRIDLIRTSILALEDELHEALLGVGWKPWATSKHLDREVFVSELVDALFFWLQLAALVGMDGDEITGRYWYKHAKNIRRHNAGYDGVTGKCPKCGQSYDDSGVKCKEGFCGVND